MKSLVASWACVVALATLLGCGSTGGGVADATSGDEGSASSEAGSSSGGMDGADDQTSGDGSDATLDGTSGDATDSSSTDATIDQGLDAGADATLDGSGALDGSGDAPGSDGAARPSPRSSRVGDTWAPSVQGADASGHYSVSGAGATLDVSSGSGTNYAVTSGTLRLAQNP
jgi:hypothetical protein